MTDSAPLKFIKSSWSGGDGGNCVEWAFAPAGVHVRDSKDRCAAELFFTHAEWDELAANVASGAPHESISVGDEVRMTGRGGELFFTTAEWEAFAAAARAGECRAELSAAS